MNQFELDFEAPTPEEKLALLRNDYLAKVGVPARTNDPNEIELALQNPESERDRLAAIDSEDNKEDLRNTYRRS